MNTSVLLSRQRWVQYDLRCAQALNRAAAYPMLYVLFRVVSRLGDGLIWYALIIALPFAAGAVGWRCAIQMLLAGMTAIAINMLLKKCIGRQRPYLACPDIRLWERALDQFSFPSGHTLHAVGFSCVLTYHFPVCALALVPFTLLVALSRVVLGLHYPSDVIAGAIFGALIGLVSIWAL